MKKNLLFILVITQIGFVAAQSLVITGDTVFSGDFNTEIEHHLDVKNISGNSISVICQKTNISLPAYLPSWGGSYYCFAGACYPTTTGTSNVTMIGSGQEISYSNNDADAHSGYYKPEGVAGIATVQYCFYDENNPSDETCVTITYSCMPTAINENQVLNEVGDFYPNPTNGMVFFTFKGNLAILKLIDILGNEIKEIILTEKGIQKLDLTDMSKGIYFGNLIVKNEIVSVKKLIVK
ncbi:MAG: T9SS type A sorting domain-containing protein [Flavobacteriales bacterium]|jgi:hypothetical protein|nr:T9SS type A sorting domain-containing protein [Flavobacteriales bacterium]MBT5090562.1 T9SS type A sorting domain-containing protein [Flavobacteriales bacterium]